MLLGVGVGAAVVGRRHRRRRPPDAPALFDQDAADARAPMPMPTPPLMPTPAAPPARAEATVLITPTLPPAAAAAERGHRALKAVGIAVALALVGGAAFAVVERPGVPRPSLAEASTVSHPADAPPAALTSGWVKTENAKPGTTDWRLSPGHAKGIEGFADMVSAQRGEAVGLYVSTKASSFHVESYRMGYYGGLGGRLVWRSDDIAGHVQPKPQMEPKTRMIETEWRPTLTVRMTSDFLPGDYLFKLVGAGDEEQYIPLTVRDDTSTAAFVVQNSVTTWQAYNIWGGADLYEGPGRGRGTTFDGRSRVVSFDRPYTLGDGSGDFLGNEFPLVTLVEQLGLDVTYWTDVDLHARPELLLKHKALLSLGHDEYWSKSMRDGAEAARDQGVNLAFFGANAAFRQIRLEESPLGPNRREVNYKVAKEDPLLRTDPKVVTTDWRNPPVSRPENSMVGPLYECNPVKADLVVYDPDAWVFKGTGLGKGDKLPGVVGSEYDRYTPGKTSPKSLQVLGHSPLKCRGKASFSDMTWYTVASGAGVFASGTNLWVPKLGVVAEVAKITENILDALGAGPAGVAHPSTPNTDGLKSSPFGPTGSVTSSTAAHHRTTTTGPSTTTGRSSVTQQWRTTTTLEPRSTPTTTS